MKPRCIQRMGESLSVEQRNMSSQEFHSAKKKKKKGFKYVRVVGSEKYKGGPECQKSGLQAPWLCDVLQLHTPAAPFARVRIRECLGRGSLVAQTVKSLPAMWETQV